MKHKDNGKSYKGVLFDGKEQTKDLLDQLELSPTTVKK